MLFIAIELILNVYRISRITGWDLVVVTNVGIAIYIMGFVFSTILLLIITKKWMEGRKANFWTLLLWFPYFVLFIFIFAFFPLIIQEMSLIL